MEYKRYPKRIFRHLLSIPFIYAMIIPIVILDVFLSVYHCVCFRLYKMPLLSRSQYIKIDRHKLGYLKWNEKIHCAYCGYANGLARYFMEIASETEKYWCGIKHEKDKNFVAPVHHKNFIEYGDENEYKRLTVK